MTKFQLLLKHQNGTTSYMTYRDRTSWSLPHAKKHQCDMIAKLVAGYFPHIAYVALVAV